MSDEFKCIRRAYLYDLLPEEDKKLANYMRSIFAKEFLVLINILRKKYRADKLKVYLRKFFHNLKEQFQSTKCYIETHKEFNHEELLKIESAIKEKFQIQNIRFKYLVNKDLLYGVSFRLNFRMYDFSLNSMLNKIKKNILQKIIEK